MTDWREVLQRLGVESKPGASEDELRAAEARLGVSLPPDYRAFLHATNGLDGLVDIEEPHDRVVLKPPGSAPNARGDH